MKLIARYLKPFAALVLVCLVLLFGQAMCDLALPNLMSDIVNVGIQQGGMEAELPEAISLQGMTLLKCFMSESDQQAMDDLYNNFEPESSEAQRLSEKYPLATKTAVCVLREGLTEQDIENGNKVYGRAAYAFLLYMQKAEETGELEEISQRFAAVRAQNQSVGEVGGNLKLPEQSGEPLPDGVLASMPEDALFTLPGDTASQPDDSVSNVEGGTMMGSREKTFGERGTVPSHPDDVVSGMEGEAMMGSEEKTFGEGEALPSQPDGVVSGMEGEAMMDSEEKTFGEGEAAPSQPGDSGQARFGLSDTDGFANADIEEVYTLLPLLAQVPESSIREAVDAAGESDSMMSGQVGVAFKKLFYQEIGIDTDEIQSDYIWRTGLKMLGVAFLGVIAAVLVGLFASRIAATVGKRLRHDLFAKVENFSNAEFDKFSTASLITRTTNDVQQVQMLVTMGIRMVCYAPIIGIGGIVFAVQKSVSMSWIVAAAVVVLTGLIIVAMALALPRFKALQKLVDRLNLVSRENLSGMMVVRAFGNEKYEEKRFEGANQELSETNRYVQRVMSLMMPAMMFVMNLMSIVIVWVGGHAIAESSLQIGDMMAFIQYAMQIIMAFLMLAAMFIMVPRASVSAVRIQEVLDTPLEITDQDAPETLAELKGEIEFKDVSFRYGGAESDVLEHISFTAKPGRTTAIIGATGSGKSTLLNLIPRFYDVTEGEITLDGVDIRRLSQKELREAIGYVPQKGILFSGTVASNIRYGKEDADGGEIDRAIEVAQARDFVSEMWDGVESPISQGGTNVSGGQRQRLSIARALVRKAPVYLFDDSFSALDFKTDAALRKALREYTSEATVIVVAQRVSTIMNAEQIIVLDGGRIAGKGTHKELLASCPEYREIAESQLQKEELE